MLLTAPTVLIENLKRCIGDVYSPATDADRGVLLMSYIHNFLVEC